MALDDLGSDDSDEGKSWLEERKDEELKDIADKLGIENKEDLEWLDNRLTEIGNELVNFDRSIERLQDKVDNLEMLIMAILRIMREDGQLGDKSEVSPGSKEGENKWQ